jgi:hypothetical protein
MASARVGKLQESGGKLNSKEKTFSREEGTAECYARPSRNLRLSAFAVRF